MTIQLSVTVRDNRLDQIESTIGVSAKLKIFSGAVPANCAAADPSGLLATITLPSDWMNNAAAGNKTLLGTWSGTGSGAGVAASFRIYDNGLAACHLQGVVTATGGGGDLTLDNTNIAVSQVINITTFTLTDSNA
jgi:hypothetical protein